MLMGYSSHHSYLHYNDAMIQNNLLLDFDYLSCYLFIDFGIRKSYFL